MSIHAVIFDMDGLMLDTERLNLSCWRRTFLEAGLPFDEQLLLDSRGKHFVAEYERWQTILGPGVDFEQLHQKKLRYVEEYISQYGVPAKLGLHALLDWLKQQGYKLALATSTAAQRADMELERVGVLDRFDVRVYGPMVAHYKPEPDIFLTACELLGEKPENCMVLEDSPNGVKAAAAAGVFTVMIPDLTGVTQDLAPLVQAQCRTLLDVIPLLECMK